MHNLKSKACPGPATLKPTHVNHKQETSSPLETVDPPVAKPLCKKYTEAQIAQIKKWIKEHRKKPVVVIAASIFT